MDNVNDINNNDGEVFPNRGAENNEEKGMAVQSLREGIAKVQRILEHNRMLLKEMGRKHEAGEAGDLNRYAALTYEFNNNIERLAILYSDLYSSFTPSITKDSSATIDGTTEGSKELGPPQ